MRLFPFLTIMLIASFLYAGAYTAKHFNAIGAPGNSAGKKTAKDFFVSSSTYPSGLTQSFAMKYAPPDTIVRDTTLLDSLSSSRIKKSSDSLDAPVKYHADDSLWMDVAHQKVYLIGNAKVEYKDITLTADSIVFDWRNNQVIAIGRKDSSGKVIGKPVFAQGDRNYHAERIAYNFKTKKGQIMEITTQEGEGYIRNDVAKRMPDGVLYGKNNIYTTCSEEHPHFYITTNKIKIVPNKSIITGPANLVIADVKTPLFVPFGIFPLSDKRKSGIIFPTYGESTLLGFYLENGGYYFGISDHVDLALTGSIYSKGTWLANAASRFSSRYHYAGRINISYANNRAFVPAENQFQASQQFKVILNFQQDPKARPNSYLSASVNFGTSGFNQIFGNPQVTYLENTYQSSIAYNQTIPNSPFHYSLSASHSQSTLTHVVNLQLPVFSFSMSQVYPFQKKVAEGNQKWYERIGLSYALDAKNQLSTLDTLLFHEDPFDKSMAGVRHLIPISASFQLLKHITITPSFNYTETWALQTINKTWDKDSLRVVNDTIRKFAAARDYSFGLSASTRIYGMLQFKKGKVQAIRHVFNPSVSYSYHPDFSDPKWNAYKTVQTDTLENERRYSIFEGGVYPGPPPGEFNGISVSLNNNLEMKVLSKKDTVSGTKKIKLLESFNIGGSYNFAVDTLRLSQIRMNGNTTLFDKIGINFGANFDPYIADELGRRQNVFVWDAEHKLVRLVNGTLGLDANFASSKKDEKTKLTESQADYLIYSGNTYSDFSIPWTLTTGYNLNLSKVITSKGTDSTVLTQTLSLRGSFDLTRKWRVSASTSYDFVNHEFPTAYIEIYRDLHCWELSMSWIPFGIRQSYSFSLRVKAGALQDLKLRKQQGWYQY